MDTSSPGSVYATSSRAHFLPSDIMKACISLVLSPPFSLCSLSLIVRHRLLIGLKCTITYDFKFHAFSSFPASTILLVAFFAYRSLPRLKMKLPSYALSF